MFFHIFSYRLKCLLRDKQTIFWTLMYPLLLATFFYMALSNINKGEVFKAIDIAVVDDSGYRNEQYFKNLINEVSKGNDRLFNLTVATEKEAKSLLEDNKIKGYIVVETPIKLIVNKSGMEQSIIKTFLDDYNQTVSTLSSILKNDPSRQHELFKFMSNRSKYVKEVPGTKSEPDNILTYYYALIAMSCFYGSFFGSRESTDIQANISPVAARINAAPLHKLKTFLYSMSASFIIQFVEMLVLLAYLYFFVKADFGQKTGYVILTTFIGSISGLTFGAFISAMIKKSEGIKTAVIIGFSMLGSTLSGMMYSDIKYIISENVPVLSYLNPMNLLTDAYYCLYYYDSMSRYFLNIGILCLFIVFFSLGTFALVRRRKYASL
jgi:ABC-2 type transport system permease protein